MNLSELSKMSTRDIIVTWVTADSDEVANECSNELDRRGYPYF